jgi:hypothetical protein
MVWQKLSLGYNKNWAAPKSLLFNLQGPIHDLNIILDMSCTKRQVN